MNRAQDEHILKNKLNMLKQKDFKLDKSDHIEEVIELMLRHIGSTDSELRDGLIYTTFAHWIISGELSKNILAYIKDSMLNHEHLFYNIGETNTDSVFVRSFSVLLIPLLLERNQARPFLERDELMEIKENLLHYIRKERDRRGFVENKGWAHTLAHTADAIHALFLYIDLPPQDYIAFLEAIKTAVCTKEVTYTNLEEERLVTAAVILFDQQKLTDAEVEDWIGSFLKWDKTEVWNEEYKIIFNIKSFLGSLYFRIHGNPKFVHTASKIEIGINTLMENYI
ncbi:DUF2785 domain-containing protein [Paenibacillus sp. Z6-24]